MLSYFKLVVSKLIAAAIFMATVLAGAIAAVLHIFIRTSLPNTDELESTPVVTDETKQHQPLKNTANTRAGILSSTSTLQKRSK